MPNHETNIGTESDRVPPSIPKDDSVIRRIERPHDRRPHPTNTVRLLRKEVIQPHLPVRLPCYDFVPIASPTFDDSLHKGWAAGFGCYQLS